MRLSDFDTWARHHHGLITLHASGLPGPTWRRAVRSGALIELHRHVARLPGAAPTPIQRIHAAVLAAGVGAAASHRSAAMLWGLLPYDDSAWVHITMADRGRHPRLTEVYVHRPTDQRRMTPRHRHQIACTDPVRTLCDLGADDPVLVRPAVVAALGNRLVTVDLLRCAVHEHSGRGRGGVPALRHALDDLGAARAAVEPTVPRAPQTLKRNSITSPSWAT